MARLSRLVAGLVGLVALSCQATTITLSQFPPNPGVLPGGGWKFTPGTTFGDPTPPRAWVNGVYGSVPKAVVTDSLALAGRAGALAVSAAHTVSLGEIAGAVARCMLGGNVICLAGSAAVAAYSAYRIAPKSLVPGSLVDDDELDRDPGMAPTTQTLGGYQASGYPVRAAAQSACNDAATPYLVGGRYASVYTLPTASAPSGMCRVYNSNGSFHVQVAIYYASYTETGCPASVDPLDGAYSIPAGSPVGSDGKCPTARYNHVGISSADAASVVTAAPPTFPSTGWNQSLQDALASGQTVSADLQTSGPASQTGTPVVSTTVSGSDTTVVTSTPTYSYTYNGDTVTYIEGDTTVTTVNGVVTSTTTTNTPPATNQDPSNPCTLNPTSVGCTELGTPPTDGIEAEEKSIVFSPVEVNSSASCPAPYVMTIRGWSLALDYQVACDIAPIIRLGVLLLAGLSGAFIVVGAVTRS